MQNSHSLLRSSSFLNFTQFLLVEADVKKYESTLGGFVGCLDKSECERWSDDKVRESSFVNVRYGSGSFTTSEKAVAKYDSP